MAIALRIDNAAVVDGMVQLKVTYGTTPLPAGASGEMWVLSLDSLGDLIQQAKDNAKEFQLASLMLRADQIDPTRGANFRNALTGRTATLDATINNMMVRS